jgi:hypothetical protein
MITTIIDIGYYKHNVIKYIKISKSSNFIVAKHAGESSGNLKIFLPAVCV